MNWPLTPPNSDSSCGTRDQATPSREVHTAASLCPSDASNPAATRRGPSEVVFLAYWSPIPPNRDTTRGKVLGSSTLSTAERLLPPAPPSVSTAPPSVDLSPHIGAKREMVAAVTDRGGRSPRPRPATRCPPHGCGRARRRSGTSSATAAAWSCRRRSAPCRLPLAHRLPTLDVPDEVGVGLTWRSLRFGLLPLRLVGAS